MVRMRGSVSEFGKRLLKWYDADQRVLPWRSARPDAYHVLLSEVMLQQTQVATVIGYFNRFLEKFPTLEKLADAKEQEVLRMWQGLGYYSRARNLLECAREIVSRHGGKVPCELRELMELPGIGRYTAGAIASIAYGRKAPILDGNVARVLSRIECIRDDIKDKKTQDRLWKTAEAVLPGKRVGEFNSALMELGARVCTPRNPACRVCPVRRHCVASARAMQDRIPKVRKRKESPLEKRSTFCIGKGGRFLIEQRPSRGRWAGLWQFVTVEAGKKPGGIKGAERLGLIQHSLSHRRYEFEVFACNCDAGFQAVPGTSHGLEARVTRKWVRLDELERYPMSRPQVEIAKLLATRGD